MKNNFDFLVGTWTSTPAAAAQGARRLDDWYEFPGHDPCWSVFDGAGNIDEVEFPTRASAG